MTTMDKLHFDRTDYSLVVKNRAPASEGRKTGAQVAVGQAPCKPSRLNGDLFYQKE
jgi:hypothetical protein